MSGAEQEFPDPLERVLVEMGLGGVRGLEKFYTTRLLDFRRRMEEQCVYLRKLYAHKIKVKVGQCGGLSSTPGNRYNNLQSPTQFHYSLSHSCRLQCFAGNFVWLGRSRLLLTSDGTRGETDATSGNNFRAQDQYQCQCTSQELSPTSQVPYFGSEAGTPG